MTLRVCPEETQGSEERRETLPEICIFRVPDCDQGMQTLGFYRQSGGKEFRGGVGIYTEGNESTDTAEAIISNRPPCEKEQRKSGV
jgi:hypothetical protein